VTAELLLRAVTAALDQAGIPFMLTGSFASAYHGAGRATMDIDLVVDPSPSATEGFVRAIEASGMYISAAAARDALAHRSMFNIVDGKSGWKADLIVRKQRPFSEEEFRRRQPIDFLGVRLHVATLEDVIVSKLEWAKLGGSMRQLEDVASLIRVQGEELDRDYVTRWVTALGLERQWSAALETDAKSRPS
jgi:hypothetical protein